MQYLHAALLLHSSNQKITEDTVEKIIKAAGLKPDGAKIKSLVSSLSDVDIEEVLSKATAFSAPVAASAAPSAAPTAKVDAPEEEPEGDDLGLSSLFG